MIGGSVTCLKGEYDVGNPGPGLGQTQKCGRVSFCYCVVFYTYTLLKDPGHFQQYFSYIMVTSFSGGRSQSTRREPPAMGKQLVNFITYGWESSASFSVINKKTNLKISNR
jgi:hypothetical protein